MKIWKKTAIILSVALAAGQGHCSSGPLVVSATSTTRQEIDRTEQEMDQLEGELEKNQENLDQMENRRDSLEKELDYLNSQMSAVVANLEDLERQIKEKEQEIIDTQAALEEAKATEEQKYASMVTLVCCMYEQQEDSYLAALFSSRSLGGLLNRADRIERVAAYDQRVLEEYKENRMLIEEHEARLRAEKIELEELQARAKEEESRVSALINDTSNSINKYSSQISDAERKALAYEAELRKKEEDLEYLKKKLAEEIAKSQAAANGVWRDISEVTFSDEDRTLLANLIYCEAGGEPDAGKLAVGSVVINRVLSAQYPDTVAGVIYQNKQFSPVASGRLALALGENRATDSCYAAADQAMAGVTNVGNCVYFRTPIEGLSGISIGGHIFY